MTEYELKSMVADWTNHFRDPLNGDKRERWDATREHLDYLIDCEPRDALTLIAAIHLRDQSAAVSLSLCPGPLERLLSEHGSLLIDTVTVFARKHPSFPSLLRNLWRNSIDEEVWSRLQAIRERRVWRESK